MAWWVVRSRCALALAAFLIALCAVSLPAVTGTAEAHAAHPTGTRVLLIGDSNVFGSFGKALQRQLEARGYVVARRGKPTSGLARPDFFDWDIEARALIARHQPQVVVMLFGGNDGQRLKFRDHRLGQIWWKDEARWSDLYRYRVRRLIEELRGDDREVILMSPTNRAPRIARERMGRVRAVQRQAVAGMERVTWVDMFEFTTDENGRWLRDGRDEHGKRVLYRRGDGIHLTPEGGVEVARRVMPTLQRQGL